MAVFNTQQKVLFQHCDPAGIVFYPRYFDMVNAVVEEWFGSRLGTPFEILHGSMDAGIPTVQLEVAFHAPSRHGDLLDFQLEPLRVGTSSVDISVRVYCADELRLSMKASLVYVDKSTTRARPWPPAIRRRITSQSTKNGNSSMHKTIQPEGWKPAKGYANGVLANGPQLYVGGQIGWNKEQVFESDDFIAQMEQTLNNVVAVVEAAGGSVADIVRLTWYVTDKREYLARQKEVGESYRRIMGRHFPAMAMLVVSELVEDRALIEIEATAVLSSQV